MMTAIEGVAAKAAETVPIRPRQQYKEKGEEFAEDDDQSGVAKDAEEGEPGMTDEENASATEEAGHRGGRGRGGRGRGRRGRGRGGRARGQGSRGRGGRGSRGRGAGQGRGPGKKKKSDAISLESSGEEEQPASASDKAQKMPLGDRVEERVIVEDILRSK